MVGAIQNRSFTKAERADSTENQDQDFELKSIQIRPKKRAGRRYNGTITTVMDNHKRGHRADRGYDFASRYELR